MIYVVHKMCWFAETRGRGNLKHRLDRRSQYIALSGMDENMCGIFGAVNTRGFFGHDMFQPLSKLNDLTSYRGPDDSGVCALTLKPSSDMSSDRFDVFLGNRRLSILDLSASGHQPMTDGEGRWIVFNGEIFNYLELRRDLEAKGHRFLTGTDTEVILHVYSEYGRDGFDLLNGMWAFAIADTAKRCVVLSRDRFSIKPLYLYRAHDCIYFASEIKQLLPFVPMRQLNERVMSAFLTQGLLDHSSETFYEGIVKLSPRTSMSISVDTGETDEKIYWEFPLERDTCPQDAAEQFRALFLDSIRLRLRSDVKVGVLLSGGLDSSAIAVGTRSLGGEQIESYSIVSADGLYDEHEFIDAVIDTGLKNQKIVFRHADVMESLDRVLHHSDEPVGGFSVVAQFKLFEAIKGQSEATVLLSGQGGDEVLLGYLKFFFFHLRSLYQQRKYQDVVAQLIASLRQRTVMRQFTLRSARRYIPALSSSSGHGVRARHRLVPVWECRDVASRQVADIEKYSVPALTHYEDRNSMAHSLEVRHPFLDHRLVAFLISLSPQLKIQNGWTKHVLRQALPELPDAVRWRRDKQGFLTPEKQWLQHDLKDVIRSTFRGSRLAQTGMLDEQKFLNYYTQFQAGAAVPESDISRIFIAEQWIRRAF
jgi:asparagine synthase (glutamine-hydrolysing)